MESGREGGTWLAISGKDKVIKVGALLNVTGEPRKQDGLGKFLPFLCRERSNHHVLVDLKAFTAKLMLIGTSLLDNWM